MGYFGLFGLLGILGYFSSGRIERRIDSRFDKFRNELNSGNNSAADIIKLQQEINRLNYFLQSCITDDGLNNFARQFKSELARELQREIENKISSSSQNFNPADLTALQNNITALEKAYKEFDVRFTALENKKIYPSAPVALPVKNDSVKILEQKISALESDNQALKQKISEQNSILAQWQNSFVQVQNNFNALQKQIDEQSKFISMYEMRFKELEKIFSDMSSAPPSVKIETPAPPVKQPVNPVFVQEVKKPLVQSEKPVQTAPIKPPVISDAVQEIKTPAAPSQFLKIQDFQLKKPSAPLFSNNPKEALKTLAVIENLTDIVVFLKNSKFDQKEIFISLINNYRQNLKKFSDKVKRQKFDEDSFSEEVSDAFFATLSDYFLSTLPVSIYRSDNKNIKFYSELLAKVNKYLAACHVYTELIEPKKLMQHDDIEKMKIIKKDTDEKSKDKIIDEVERLPYFLDYLTSDGEIGNYRLEGKMVVFKFNGGKK